MAWTKALPIVLLQMRARVRPKYGLSPFEILFGRPPSTEIGPTRGQLPTTDQCDDVNLNYFATLSSALCNIHRQVKEAIPHPVTGPLHNLIPGTGSW